MASSHILYFSQTALAIFLILSTSAAASPSSSPSPNSRRLTFSKIYAFGDSYTDTGNTHSSTGPNAFTYVSNLPYGRTFFHHPTNRYSDGRLVIDFVAESLSLPFLPPYLDSKADRSHGTNFAVAGSTAIEHGFFARNNISLDITPQSLGTELRWFSAYVEEEMGCRGAATTARGCAAVFDDALVWVGEIGANDYAYTTGSSISGRTIQRLAIKRVNDFLLELLNKGAKYVVVQGLPPTGCLTLALALASQSDRDDMGCVASANKQSSDHNAILQSNLQGLRRQFPHAVIVYADYWSAYRDVLRNMPGHGFTEPFKVCCGSGSDPYNFDVFGTCGSPSSSSSCADPSRYINWDGVHLTEAMYKVVADSFVNGTFCRPSFDYLLSMRRRSSG